MFDLIPQFKNKYFISWCDLCDCASITCPKCKLPSCSGGGCDECRNDFTEWHQNRKIRIQDYLNPEEILIHEKIETLKKLIIQTAQTDKLINFKQLQSDGALSKNDENLLKEFLL